MIFKIPFILGILCVCPESPDGPQLSELSFVDCSVTGAAEVHCRHTLKRIPIWLIYGDLQKYLISGSKP